MNSLLPRKSQKSKKSETLKNVVDKIQSNSSANSSLEVCIGCKKQFKRISRHLTGSISCQKYYDMKELKESASELIRENKREHIKNKRLGMGEKQKEVELVKRRERYIKNRGVELAKRKEVYIKNRAEEVVGASVRMKRKRGNMNDEERNAYQLKAALWKVKSLTKRFKRMNDSKFKRRRIFTDAVRDGPIFPCISCHRLLYNNAVNTIKNLNKFRLKIDAVTSNLFEEVIGSSIEKIPSLKGKYYLCSTCKIYIFKGKMPPMSNQNNLETFNYKDYPELKLTEISIFCNL